VAFVDGDHDNTGLLLSRYAERDEDGLVVVRPRIRYAPRGHRWTWDGARLAAFGGAYSVDKSLRLFREREKAAKIRIANSHRPADRQRSEDTSGWLWLPDEEMTDAEFAALLGDEPEPVDVLVTHDKPRATRPAVNRKAIAACFPNQDRLQRAVEA